jgi:hypothetical protein
MRKEYEFEVGDLVHVVPISAVGTILEKRREHVSSYGPRLDVVYDVLVPAAGSVQRNLSWSMMLLLQGGQE